VQVVGHPEVSGTLYYTSQSAVAAERNRENLRFLKGEGFGHPKVRDDCCYPIKLYNPNLFNIKKFRQIVELRAKLASSARKEYRAK
jgi:hypothetical protein